MTEIIEWLKNYSNRSGVGKFVVGISGGIDSALTSTLCAETGIPTILLSMPIHQHTSELNRAHNHMKSEVRKMAKGLGVDGEILVALPTDGLWGDGRSDEDQLGATYDELERAMMVTPKEFTDYPSWTDREKEVWRIYNRLNDANRHKMDPIPVFIKNKK